MFDTETPATKSNRVIIALVIVIVLVILLGATWYVTRP